jgi:hypothetical protein
MSRFPEEISAGGAGLQPDVQPQTDMAAPAGEVVPAWAGTARDRFFQAREALQQRSRDANGTFAPEGAGGRLTHGTRSQLLATFLNDWVDEHERGLLADLGGKAELTHAHQLVVRQLARAAVGEDIAWQDMGQSGGPTSSKGHKRRIFDMHGTLSERVVRFAEKAGLQRRAKQVDLARALSGQDGPQ